MVVFSTDPIGIRAWRFLKIQVLNSYWLRRKEPMFCRTKNLCLGLILSSLFNVICRDYFFTYFKNHHLLIISSPQSLIQVFFWCFSGFLFFFFLIFATNIRVTPIMKTRNFFSSFKIWFFLTIIVTWKIFFFILPHKIIELMNLWLKNDNTYIFKCDLWALTGVKWGLTMYSISIQGGL